MFDLLRNIFNADHGIPGLNLLPMPIDDCPHPNKRARNSPDSMSANISVAPENSPRTLTWPYNSPIIYFLSSYFPVLDHNIV